MKRDVEISVGAVKVFVGVMQGSKENKDHPPTDGADGS